MAGPQVSMELEKLGQYPIPMGGEEMKRTISEMIDHCQHNIDLHNEELIRGKQTIEEFRNAIKQALERLDADENKQKDQEAQIQHWRRFKDRLHEALNAGQALPAGCEWDMNLITQSGED